MLEFYTCYVTTYHNNTEIGTHSFTCTIDDTKAINYTEELSWENITEKYRENGFDYCFNIWNLKRGRVVCFFVDTVKEMLFNKDCKKVAEWKNKPLNIKIEYEYRKREVSLEEVFKLPAPKAVQYLKEHNLMIIQEETKKDPYSIPPAKYPYTIPDKEAPYPFVCVYAAPPYEPTITWGNSYEDYIITDSNKLKK
jgi:hypothetical protein